MRANATASRTGNRLKFTSEGLVWFVAAVILGALGWFKSLNLLLMLAYLMLALLAINGVLARLHVGRILARRMPLEPIFAGDEARLAVAVSNRNAHRSASVAVQDRRTQWSIERLEPNSSVEFADAATFPKRGRVALAPLVVWSAFPFGFLRYERVEEQRDSLIVLPAVGWADADGLRRWVLRMAGTEGRSRKVLRRVTTDLAELRGVRPYRSGDSIRSIHWRSSARRRELMVREYDAAPSPELLLVVEPWLPANPTPQSHENLEAALSLAATVVLVWCRSIGTRIAVIVEGSNTAGASGPPSEAFAREALIPLGEAEGKANATSVDGTALGRSSRAARVLISSRANSPFADALGRAAGKPFVCIDPSQRLPWYRAPKAG